jgi:hypothetical protein
MQTCYEKRCLYLEARVRPTAQARLDETIKTILQLVCRGNEILSAENEIVFASIEWLAIIDPGIDVFMVALWRAS